MVWIIIIAALGFILGALMTVKYTANMKMHIPEELKNQYNKALHLDAGEHAKPLDEESAEQGYDNDYHNDYDNGYQHNPIPDPIPDPIPEKPSATNSTAQTVRDRDSANKTKRH